MFSVFLYFINVHSNCYDFLPSLCLGLVCFFYKCLKLETWMINLKAFLFIDIWLDNCFIHLKVFPNFQVTSFLTHGFLGLWLSISIYMSIFQISFSYWLLISLHCVRDILCIISVLLNVLGFILWPNIWYILRRKGNISCALERNVYFKIAWSSIF